MYQSRAQFFSKLFTESEAALRRYVRRLVPSRDTSDEIVQEAFLRTFECADSDKAPRAFLYSVARNLATDHRRHARIARTDTLGDITILDLVSPWDSPETGLLAAERSRLLKEAIEHLSPQRRVVFALKVFHACSYKEISQKLGISTKTVENHIAQASRETHLYLHSRYRKGKTGHG
jgi:RNA polymerase sigma-70 factor (ECF subfamily)